MQAEHTTGSARDQLAGLLTGLVERTHGARRALLATEDGLKVAHTEDTSTWADTTAASTSGFLGMARGQFRGQPGGVRQVVVEHDAGTLFLMSAGTTQQGTKSTILGVETGPEADPGEVGHQMSTLIAGLDEHLLVQARVSFGG